MQMSGKKMDGLSPSVKAKESDRPAGNFLSLLFFMAPLRRDRKFSCHRKKAENERRDCKKVFRTFCL